MVNNTWKTGGGMFGNLVLKRENWHVSYLSASTNGFIGTIFAPDEDADETAIFDEVQGKFYILNGDYRKEYEQFENFSDALEFYKKQNTKSSFTEEHLPGRNLAN